MSHSIQTPAPRRPPAPGGPLPGKGAPQRPPAPPPISKPLLIGDLSFVLIGITGVLAIALAVVTAVLIGALSGTEVNLVWFTTRGSGIAAYVLMVGVMVYGLLLSARSNSGAAARRQRENPRLPGRAHGFLRRRQSQDRGLPLKS